MMTGDRGPTWKIGQLASDTGLTVRTLHHYDHIGLVCPSQRTPTGHRLYTECDVQRLYQVLALRQVGLPLEAISAVLDRNTSIAALLRQHRDYLEQQLVALRTLHAQLTTVLCAAEAATVVTVTDFLHLIRKVITVDDTIRKHFSDAQLAALAERRTQVGEQAIADAQARWRDLLPRVRRAVETGLDPSSSEAKEMAREWMDLLHQFHGGDEGLRDSLYRMQAANTERIEREYGGPSQEQLEFIKRANATLS